MLDARARRRDSLGGLAARHGRRSLWSRHVARGDGVPDALDADGCRIGSNSDDDGVTDDAGLARELSLAAKESQALSDTDTAIAAPIDHHQSSRCAQHLALIRKENPGEAAIKIKNNIVLTSFIRGSPTCCRQEVTLCASGAHPVTC